MKIEILLPVRVNVPGRDCDLDRLTRGLLPSLIKFDYHKITARFVIICPEEDVSPIRDALGPFSQFDFHILSDESFQPKLGFAEAEFRAVPGWFKQQLFKLAAGSEAESEILLVLDADVIATRPHPDLFSENAKLPYQKMGVARFRNWFAASATALGVDFATITESQLVGAMGVTPEFLSRSVTRGVVERLKIVGGSPAWGPYLVKNTRDYEHTWTEFSLYWVWYCVDGIRCVTHTPVQLYDFVNDPSRVHLDLLSGPAYFAVLQSAKLSVPDCELLYAAL